MQNVTMPFEYDLMPEEQVKGHIKDCEGRHVQQVAYSSYMDTLTQVCFTCQKIRGSHLWENNRSWKVPF